MILNNSNWFFRPVNPSLEHLCIALHLKAGFSGVGLWRCASKQVAMCFERTLRIFSFREFVVILLLSLFFLSSNAQQSAPPLERLVNLDFEKSKAEVVLQEIERQTGVSFSYAASLISPEMMVTVKLKQRTVREALDRMFQGKVNYKTRNNHVILAKAPAQPKVIGGYVENSRGEKLGGASVYDPNTMASATTNEYGYFEMKIRRTTPVNLQVSKSNYADTVVPIQLATPTLQNIVIEEKRDTTLRFMLDIMKSTKDSVVSAVKDAGIWMRSNLVWNENIRNIRDSLHRPFQVSLVPFVGTNGKLSGNVTNDFSWNILAGYNGGVNKFEFAGLLNVDRGDVSYFQFAGLSNIVGGNVRGLQFAGLSNLNAGDIIGLQYAGFINVNVGRLSGVQSSGFANINGDSISGVQLAGFANIAGSYVDGAQFSGFGNIAADGFHGAQFAGFINVAGKKSRGVQVSGFINVAKDSKGSQIGVFNFSDTLSGVPIGIFSFVKSGYHKLEISYDELDYVHLSLRSGVRHFHNIIGVAVQPDFDADTTDWSFSYGLGIAPKINDRFDLNVDLTATQLVHGNLDIALNGIARLQTGIDFHITKNISVFGAAVLNGYFYEDDADRLEGINRFNTVYSDNLGNGYQFTSWIGWKAGIRIF